MQLPWELLRSADKIDAGAALLDLLRLTSLSSDSPIPWRSISELDLPWDNFDQAEIKTEAETEVKVESKEDSVDVKTKIEDEVMDGVSQR